MRHPFARGRQAPRRPRLRLVLAGLTVGMMCAAAAAQAVPPASIDGGADASGHHYVWTVTNKGESPIVSIEIPHYHGDLFITPEGWSSDGSTNLIQVGAKDAPGVCVARAVETSRGVAPGASAEFRLRIAGAGAERGRGDVLVRFADGSDYVIGDVELSRPPSASDKYLSLVALGFMFLCWLVFQGVRRRRTR